MRGARYHEAAHAVAAYHHGWRINSVIVTDEDWTTNFSHPAFGGAEYWREACVTLAGWYADQREGWGEIRPETWWEFLRGALEERRLRDEGDEFACGDRDQLLDALEGMAASYPYAPREKCYRQVVEDTRELVSEHWSQIEAVARALECSGTLDGAEVVRLIEEATPT